MALIGLHYAWLAAASLAALAPAKALLYILVSQLICGVLLGIVFVQSHNGMAVYNAPTDFVTAQVISTRDILSSAWTDWFTGRCCPVVHITEQPLQCDHGLDRRVCQRPEDGAVSSRRSQFPGGASSISGASPSQPGEGSAQGERTMLQTWPPLRDLLHGREHATGHPVPCRHRQARLGCAVAIRSFSRFLRARLSCNLPCCDQRQH